MALFDSIRMGSSGTVDDFEIDRSLRFNNSGGDNHYLVRTPSSAGDRRTFTFSCWVKRGQIDASEYRSMFAAGTQASPVDYFLWWNTDQLAFSNYNSTEYIVRTTRVFRDPTAWYHLVLAVDTTQGTASNRVKIYVNGSLETDLAASNYPSQNYQTEVNNTTTNFVGYNAFNYMDGYMAEVTLIDGLQLTPSSFGRTNAVTGQWVPKNTGGLTYGTNGFRLQFSDNSNTTATTLGKDTSGNSNNFTPNNFNVTANSVENDSVLDTPTNNWCTLNPLTGGWTEGGSIPLADGNLHADNPNSGDRSVHATFTLKAGKKYYIEGVYLEPSGGGSQCKWALSSLDRNNGMPKKPVGTGSFGIDWRGGAGTTQSIDESSQNNIGSRPASGTVIGVAIDLVNGKFYAHQGNTYYNSGNPDNGTGAIITGIPTGVDYFFTTSVDSGGPNFSEFKINFGQQGFQHQPSTFTDLANSQSLADPSILLPNKYFDTLLYTANRTARSITGLEFQPDFVWIKDRGGSQNHALFDSVRGANIQVRSDDTGGDVTATSPNFSLTSFDSNGFSLGTDMGVGDVNYNLTNHVAWNWKAGDSTVTNNDGAISSQVRANTTAGFSIVTYTGDGGNPSTVGHGLGVAADVLIIKNRSNAANWGVFHHKNSSEPATEVIYLNSTSASQDRGVFNDTMPTSTVFSVKAFDEVNNNNQTYVAYCFSEVAGYSKFGSYRGNGSTNGSFVFTGFRPAWVLVKNSSSSYSWDLNDNTRDPDNVCEKVLAPNLNDAEATATSMDFTANGFKLRVNNNSQNRNGDTFIFLAFAESPFKNSRAR